MLSGGRVYTRDSDGNLILNVATGELINLVIAATNDGLLQALAIEDGAVISSTQLPAAPAGPDEQNVSQPLTGFSAAEDKLFIPCGQQLLAF
jgi:hypothetical protein